MTFEVSLRRASAAALAAYWLPAASLLVFPARRVFGIQSRIAGAPGVVLTFDDGPHPDGTPAMLEALAERRATATFFLVGEQVERRPSLAREITAAGHRIGIHCYRHRSLLLLTPREARDDLRRAEAVIAEATGDAPDVYRPPYGLFSFPALVLVRRRGLQPLLWTHDAYDWRRRTTSSTIAARLARARLRPSDVVLMHDADFYTTPGSWRQTVAALPLLLDELERRGLAAVPIPPGWTGKAAGAA